MKSLKKSTDLIPDGERYASLRDQVRADVDSWVKELMLAQECRHGELGPMLEDIGRRLGCSSVTARRKFDLFNRHGWTTLINKNKSKRFGETKLPAQFLVWWKYLCESNQRNSRAAYKYLIQTWRHTDQAIPGYAIQPPAGRYGHPDGWSYANLIKHAPTTHELTVGRIGRTAAAEFRPLVLTTRVGLEVGEFYQFDDLWHDFKVNAIGLNQKAHRPMELCALDLFSGCKFAWGVRPMLEGDAGAMEHFKKTDMRFLLAHILINYGYRPAGTTLIVEHGTAAIETDLEECLARLSNDKIKVQRSGITGASALHGWYEGRGKGNFRMKASLEALHSLAHSMTAMLPGQMGLSRDRAPEELHGREKQNNLLMAAIKKAKLPPEKIELIRFGFMHISVFTDLLDYIYRIINARDDHDLEGWQEAGLITERYRLGIEDKRWFPLRPLLMRTDPEAQALRQHIYAHDLMRCFKMSPTEVYESGRKNLVRFPAWVLPQILGDDLSEIRTVSKRGTFEFRDNAIHPETQVYLARPTNERGLSILLREGDKFKTHVNPFDPSVMVVSTEDGALIGICRRIDRVSRNNQEEIIRTIGARAHDEKVRLAEFRARHQGDVDQKLADEEWNAKVISGAPVLPAEIEAHERMMNDEGGLEDVVVPSAVSREVLESQAMDDQAAAANELGNMFKR